MPFRYCLLTVVLLANAFVALTKGYESFSIASIIAAVFVLMLGVQAALDLSATTSAPRPPMAGAGGEGGQ